MSLQDWHNRGVPGYSESAVPGTTGIWRTADAANATSPDTTQAGVPTAEMWRGTPDPGAVEASVVERRRLAAGAGLVRSTVEA